MEKKVFEKLIKNSKPVRYKEDSTTNITEWRNKIKIYSQDKNVISVDSSVSIQTYPDNPKRYKTTHYTDTDQDGKKFFAGEYDGNITYKFPFSEYHSEDNYYYSEAYSSHLMRILEKKYPNEKLAISNGYLDKITENDTKFYFFTLYCSEDLAKKIPKKYVKTPFLKHYYYIDLQME